MKHAFKTPVPTGALALVIALMAFGATAAQAEPGAYWLVNGADVGKSLLPGVQARKDTTHITFLVKVGVSTADILCSEVKLAGAKLHELGRFTGKMHYEGCVTILNGNPANNCKPKSPGATVGLIETNALDGLLKLHASADGTKHEQLELKPTVGTTFVTIELGALCAVGNKFDVTGKLLFEDGSSEGLVDKIEHLFEEGPLSALLRGPNQMTIDGGFWMFLTGEHEGMTFAGHAG
jgi:hypothetical protein